MIKRLELRNFTAFTSLALDLSPKINVIIGENGTGKTHLLKAAYGLCAGAPLFKNKPDTSEDELEIALTTNLLRLFMPLDDKLGKMHRQGATEQGYLSARFAQGQMIAATFFNNSKALAIQDRAHYEQYQSEAVFIPTKEVLSFMKGFNSLYEKYELSFDQTYQDICLLLDLPAVRTETLHEKSKWAMAEIEGICGGRFVFYGGGNVTFKTENAEYSANAIAEGFRKVGILSRLLETGAIQPGVSGPLFWDEPESNLNPKLMQLLVQILLELSRNGQQVILSSHDYVLLKWFDLLMDAGKGDHVRFHSLYRDQESREIKVSSTDDYLNIRPNPIDEAFGVLINQEIEKEMGVLGK
ncbi:AAA family ATPase [Allochromatium palmeri]|uniref:AAA family ATPase n=1 Tax=Allochromatium palmeri TaxID=231048 RepID=A0A6N8EC79_9GAMM|nr:AAA family ATPase [Allochromatium palmeri]MTW21823.1 AAA family ATPase [Allochromatium palmeri]